MTAVDNLSRPRFRASMPPVQPRMPITLLGCSKFSFSFLFCEMLRPTFSHQLETDVEFLGRRIRFTPAHCANTFDVVRQTNGNLGAYFDAAVRFQSATGRRQIQNSSEAATKYGLDLRRHKSLNSMLGALRMFFHIANC